jgi:hypothetical protein
MFGGLLVVLLVVTFQSPAVDALTGTWVSTIQPPSGEAPAMAPRLNFVRQDGKLLVSVDDRKAQMEVTTFTGSPGEVVGLVKLPSAGGGERMLIVRTVGPERLRCELFVSYPAPRAASNFVYAEVFRREK